MYVSLSSIGLISPFTETGIRSVTLGLRERLTLGAINYAIFRPKTSTCSPNHVNDQFLSVLYIIVKRICLQ